MAAVPKTFQTGDGKRRSRLFPTPLIGQVHVDATTGKKKHRREYHKDHGQDAQRAHHDNAQQR